MYGAAYSFCSKIVSSMPHWTAESGPSRLQDIERHARGALVHAHEHGAFGKRARFFVALDAEVTRWRPSKGRSAPLGIEQAHRRWPRIAASWPRVSVATPCRCSRSMSTRPLARDHVGGGEVRGDRGLHLVVEHGRGVDRRVEVDGVEAAGQGALLLLLADALVIEGHSLFADHAVEVDLDLAAGHASDVPVGLRDGGVQSGEQLERVAHDVVMRPDAGAEGLQAVGLDQQSGAVLDGGIAVGVARLEGGPLIARCRSRTPRRARRRGRRTPCAPAVSGRNFSRDQSATLGATSGPVAMW